MIVSIFLMMVFRAQKKLHTIFDYHNQCKTVQFLNMRQYLFVDDILTLFLTAVHCKKIDSNHALDLL